MFVNGVDFTAEILGRIQRIIDTQPGISRVKLSRAVCELLDWKSITGKLKDMSCRVALLKLERDGKLSLPAPHPFGNGGTRPTPVTKASEELTGHEEEQIQGTLKSLGRIVLIRIDSSSSSASRQWNGIMSRYHYLGAGPLCGAQIRYLIRDSYDRILGGLSFSASAIAVKDRDKWIGWDSYTRMENLQLIICNSRFLILPSVKVPHLATHVLGLICRRIANDWLERYGYKPVLLETYVDSERFKGTSYRAGNWIYVGATSGRSRQDRNHDLQVSRKKIFIFELNKHARSVLCAGSGKSKPEPVSDESVKEPRDWVEEEFGGVDFNDQRLEQRLLTIARDFWARPQANIPQACQSRAKVKAAYRFFEHEATTMDAILTPHYEATINRINKEKIILAVQDTTELDYATHTATEGLGPVGTDKDGAVGLFVHDTLAITPEGTPLGLIDVQCWARDKEQFGKRFRRHDLPIEEKESNKWLKSFRAAQEVQKHCTGTMVVSVGDRESDIFELFVEARYAGNTTKLLIRARIDRPVADHEYLWTTLKTQSAQLVTTVTVPRRGNRAARIATLEVRYKEMTIRPPKRKPGLRPVTLSAIAATEIQVPDGVEPIEWLLLTNKTIASDDNALEALRWYSRRWGIEIYHRTLKSGCRIEQRQLGSADRIEACLAIDMVIAWRIYYLTKMGRETPDVPCTVFFEDYEWKALVTHITKKKELPANPPSLRDAVRMVASLGGFLGRKCDGEPGAKTTWLGLQYLDGLSTMFKYMAETYAPQLLCAPVSPTISYG
jgi:hypothetical protein